ncbi:Thiamine-monophosphate kinase [Candidatus Gugararchaeum adminiculabundum]|nr:Thiamine-monophosphate kinase [Candidatus Gugararchaeum adminiculabundum]
MPLSERSVVDKIISQCGKNRVLLVPPGDDAAVLVAGKSKITVSTDIMIASSHFPPSLPLEAVGFRAAVSNFSDLAAMGSQPLAFLASIAVPKIFTEEQVLEIVAGIKRACKRHGAVLAGGDMKCARELTICGTAIGTQRENPILRSGAKPGQVVFTTGNLGEATCGQFSLQKGLNQKDLEKSFMEPPVRVKISLAAAKEGAGGVDITDGLIFSCCEIAHRSKVGIDIDLLPISPRVRMFASKHDLGLLGLADYGGDYELLLTTSEESFKKLSKKFKLIRIGKVVKKKGVRLLGVPVESSGYDAFRH